MKNVSPMDLGINGATIVLKTRPFTRGEDGKKVVEEGVKFSLLQNMRRIVSQKNGKVYYVTDRPEGETGGDTYLIAAANTVKSSNHPIAYLKLLPPADAADDAEATIVCGLYLKKYDDGSFSLKGTPLGEDAPTIEYFVAENKFANSDAKTGTNG